MKQTNMRRKNKTKKKYLRGGGLPPQMAMMKKASDMASKVDMEKVKDVASKVDVNVEKNNSPTPEAAVAAEGNSPSTSQDNSSSEDVAASKDPSYISQLSNSTLGTLLWDAIKHTQGKTDIAKYEAAENVARRVGPNLSRIIKNMIFNKIEMDDQAKAILDPAIQNVANLTVMDGVLRVFNNIEQRAISVPYIGRVISATITLDKFKTYLKEMRSKNVVQITDDIAELPYKMPCNPTDKVCNALHVRAQEELILECDPYDWICKALHVSSQEAQRIEGNLRQVMAETLSNPEESDETGGQTGGSKKNNIDKMLARVNKSIKNFHKTTKKLAR